MNEGRDVWSGGNFIEKGAEVNKSLRKGLDRYRLTDLFPKKVPLTEVELMEKELEQVQIDIEKERARRRGEEVIEKDGTSEGAKLGWETRRHGGTSASSESSDRPKPDEGEYYPPEAERAKEQQRMAAQTILQQMGGNRFAVITGARNFTSIPGQDTRGGLQFSINGKGPKGTVNRVKIEVDPMDTYRVEFGRVRDGKYKVVSSHEGVYNDQLQDIFETETGLYTTLHPRKSEEPVEHLFASDSPVDKDGTSEGAKLGWESRRRGGAPTAEAVAPEGKPGAYQQAKKYIEGAYNTLAGIHGKAKRGEDVPMKDFGSVLMAVDSALDEAFAGEHLPPEIRSLRASAREDSIDAKERAGRYLDYISQAENLVTRRLRDKKKDLEGDTESPFASGSLIGKDGTSEGAKKGWETRRRGGAKEEQPGEKKPWANLNPEEELPGLKGLDPEKAYKIEEQMEDVDQTMRWTKEKLNRMNSVSAREGRRLGEDHPYFDVKRGIEDGTKQINSLLESIKGHADEAKRQSLVDESERVKDHYEYYGSEGLEETVGSLSNLSSKVTALIDGEDSKKDKSLSERLDDVAKRCLHPETISKDMVEKILKGAGWDKLPISDKAREVIEDMIAKGAKPVTEFTGKIMIERGFPEEAPAFVRPNTLNVGDRIVPLDWRWIGGHGATIDLPNVPEAKRIKKMYTGPAKVSKDSYPYGRYPKDISKVETITEDRLWGLEAEDRLGKQNGDDTMSLPITTRDTTLVLRVPAMASPEGEVNTGDSVRD